MKKAKIMLMAIAVLGVVGGAVAFKAKSFGGIPIYYSTTATQNATKLYSLSATTTASGLTFYYTTSFNSPATIKAFLTTTP